jgi:ubiquinone/menaquinone biosynthesis C-methylase UbiE
MPAQKQYTFIDIEHCNMCGSSVAGHKILGKRLNRSQGRNPKNKIGITTTVMRCETCRLVYANPQPIPKNLQDHYGIPPEAYWSEAYFKINDRYFTQEINTLKKLYPFKPGDKALDIGAGLGKCMIALSTAGFDTYGLEPSEPFYERAIQKMKIDPTRLKLASVETSGYPDNYFDFITFGAVLEHLYDPSDAILKAMRWLKKDGIMQIEVPSSDWLISKLFNAYYRLRGLDYVTNISPMHEPYHLYEFSLRSFQEHAKLHDYQIAFSEYYVARTFLPRILDFFIIPYMRRSKTGMQLCVWLKK